MHYNPFAYIETEQDVLKFVNTLIANTKGEGAQSGEDFWVKAERLLFTAYVAYIIKYCKKSEQNFVSLLTMIDGSRLGVCLNFICPFGKVIEVKKNILDFFIG